MLAWRFGAEIRRGHVQDGWVAGLETQAMFKREFCIGGLIDM
jgi:hypothetical protein